MDPEPLSLVIVANRLPLEAAAAERHLPVTWRHSPGGLVTAMEAVMRTSPGAWVGWSGTPGVELEPFVDRGTLLWPVTLSADEVARYYEGFANASLWPLYHDGIATPEYHREWWASYAAVNHRFAEVAAQAAAPAATVWVHDYQLQLVPGMLRTMRPDLRIGHFMHVPFPPREIFRQIPWRRQLLEGLLGADVLGFQRSGDAANFRRAVALLLGYRTRQSLVTVPAAGDGATHPAERHVLAAAFPISIDSKDYDALARLPEVQARAAEIRRELGNPRVLLLGIDRLDYTKGITHRLRAFSELLSEGRLDASGAVLVQVASPSRSRVALYRSLRAEVEETVGNINGEFSTLSHQPVIHLHHALPREEVVALCLAADVMLVTALRDGMNLVAKEYVASRHDLGGVLVLSEFTGAADELTQALLVNPYDIDGLKSAIVRAVRMEPAERRRRMRALRRRVMESDVDAWAAAFLAALRAERR